MTNPGRLPNLRIRSWAAAGCAILLLGALESPAAADHDNDATQSFDFDNGNALFEVIFPTNQPLERIAISASGSDASLIVYFGMHLQAAWFDAIAPYHPTAVGFHSDLGRRPESEATNRNRNIAVLYTSYRILQDFMPQFSTEWRAMMTSVGLDPDDDQENPETAIGLGNLAARHVIESREDDGMNRRGTEGGVQYHRQPYADYTGYQPVNTAYKLRNPSRWQPDVVPKGNGIFAVQQFVTPQLGRVEAFTFDDPGEFLALPPRDSNHKRPHAYQRQADEVLAASAGLTDRQKMMAELFNDKFLSLAAVPGTAVLLSQNWDIEQFVHFLSTAEVALFDAAVATWHNKEHYDAVRPFSAIRYLYGDEPVTAWGGPGMGTVEDITGNEWRSYLATADHPEYPSGSTSLCHAYAEAAQLFLGTDEIEIRWPAPAGSSLVEPGITPATDLILSWDTWTDYAEDCGMSRLWSGVHFLPSIENAVGYSTQIGERAYELVQRHIAGDV